MNPDEIRKFYAAVKDAQNGLIRRAKSRGVYENFGQRELRGLYDIVGANLYTAPQEVRNALFVFERWCESYTG